MRKSTAAKGRRAIALLLLLVMCLGNITPALAQEIAETSESVYSEIVSRISSDSESSTEGAEDEAGPTTEDENKENEEETEDGAEGDKDPSDEDSDGEESGAENSEDQDDSDDESDPSDEDLDDEEKDPDGADENVGENPDENLEDLPLLEATADLLDSVPVPVDDLDGLIDALNDQPQPAEIELKALITLDDQAKVDDLNDAIAALTEEVVIYASTVRHFNVTGTDIELVLGDKIILDGSGEAGGINIATPAADGNQFVLKGGVIRNCAAVSLGIVHVNNARISVEIEETQFLDNSGVVIQQAGMPGSYLTANSLTIKGARFEDNENNSSSNQGIVRQASGYSEMRIIDTNFVNNTSTHGVIYQSMQNYATVIVEGGTISGNTATNSSGGAVAYVTGYNRGAVMELKGVTIRDNRGVTNGYGAIVVNNGNLLVEDCTFEGHTEPSIYARDAQTGYVTITDSTFRNNTFNNKGGAIQVGAVDSTEITNTKFEKNRSLNGAGGAVYLSSSATIDGCEFIDNSSLGVGGAIYASQAITFKGINIFTGNRSENNGGAIFANLNTLDVDADAELYFSDNQANGFYQLSDEDRSTTYANHPLLTTGAVKSVSYPGAVADGGLNNYDVNYTSGGTPQYEIVYHPNDSDEGVATSVFAEKDSTITIADPETLDFAKEDHIFVGWSTEPLEDDGNWYQIGDSHKVANSLTLYARWMPKVAVTFYWNRPEDSNPDPYGILERPENGTISYGDSDYADLGGHPELTGYRFDGWAVDKDGPVDYTPTAEEIALSDEDLKLYAQWSKEHTIRFYQDAETLHVDAISVYNEDEYEVPADPQREGYRFAGWLTDLEDETSLVDGLTSGASITATADADYYAKWVKTLTIRYFDGDTQIYTDETDAYEGEEKAEIREYPTAFGKYARIWNTSADGSGDEYAAGTLVTANDANLPVVLNLYIQWTELTDQVAVSVLNEPVAAYGLLGWYLGTGLTGDAHTYFTMLTGEGTEINSTFAVALGEADSGRNADVYLVFGAGSEVSGRTVAFTAPTELTPYVQSGAMDANGQLQMTIDSLNTLDEYEAAAYADLKEQGFTDDAYYLQLSGADFAAITDAVGSTFPVTALETIAAGDVQFADGVSATSLSYQLQAGHHAVNLTPDTEAVYTGYSFLEPELGLDISFDLDPDSAIVGDTITVTLTAQNLSNIGLADVVLTILKGTNAQNAEPFDTGLLGDLAISYTPYGADTPQDLGSVSDHTYTIDYWDGSLNPAAFGDDHENGIYTITFTYVVQAEDVVVLSEEDSAFNVPFFITLTGRTPQLSLDQTKVAAGADFSEWYTGSDLKDAVVGAPQLYDEATPALGIGTSTIRYDANGGSGSLGDVITISGLVAGNVYELLADTDSALDFSRAYHEFLGWTTEAVWNGDVDALLAPGTEVVADGATYFAQWNALNYPVTYVQNPDPSLGKDDVLVTDEEDRYLVGDEVSLNENLFTAEDYLYLFEYNFLGWSLDQDWDGSAEALYQPGEAIPMAEGGLVLYAQWQRLTYFLTYDANHPLVTGENSTYTDSTAYTSIESFTVWDNPFAASLYPGLEEYEFLGWTAYDDEEYDADDLILAETDQIMGSGDRTLYARWNRYTYRITYHSNYPNGATDEFQTDDTLYGKGDTLTLWDADTYTADEFTLLSWNTEVDGSGDRYAPGGEIEMGSGDLVLYAQWSQSEYNVTYDSNSGGLATGSTEDLAAYIKGASVTVQENGFAYSGYTFTGWNTKENGSGQTYLPGVAGQDTLSMPSGGITLYAQWIQNQHYLSYDHNHADFTEEERILVSGPYGAGSDVVLTAPTRILDGYWFLGWSFSAENSEQEWLAAGETITMPDEALTLYAQWQSQEITEADVVYYANDGSDHSFSETLPIGAAMIILSSQFARADYTFLSWNTKADGTGTVYNPDDEIESLPPQGLKLYAQWQQITYPLTFLANEDQYPGMVVTGDLEALQLPKGSEVTMPESPYQADHYTFFSWNTAADGSGETYLPGSVYAMPDEAVTFYAQWHHDVYGVTYESGYAGGPNAITDETRYEADEVVTVKSGSIFARDGYAFAGWALTAEEEENERRYDPQDAANNSFAMPAEDVTLYARWDLIQYTLSYEVNDAGSVIVPSATYHAKYDVVEVAANTHSHTSGLEFLGWNTQANGAGTWYRPGAELTILGDVTLYAQWGDKSTITDVTITYAPNGADSPAAAHQLTAAPESSHTVLAETDSNLSYTKEDYLFIGWNTGANGEGTWYAPEDSLEVPYYDVTLYAQWEKESHDVIYLANRFAGDTERETARYEVGASFTVANNTFAKEDYHFIGWNTKADGSGEAITPGVSLFMAGEDILLYAQWEENTYTITFDSNRGDGLQEIDPERYAKGRQLTLPDGGDLFAYDDVIFLGWSLRADAPLAQWLDAEALFTMPAEDVTLYAQWKDVAITTSTITYLPGSGLGAAFSEDAEMGSEYAIRSVENDQIAFTKLNSEFAGWNTKEDGTGASYGEGDTITVPKRDLVLYAQWEAVAVTVLYNANDDSETPAEITATVALGGDHVAQDAAALGFEKTGSRFLGFNTEADGSGSWYQPGQEMSGLHADVTLYAIYSVDSGVYHPVLYSANADYYGWDSYQGSVVDENNPYRANSTVTILKNGYTKDGYRFLGWNTKLDGSGDYYVAADEEDETLTGASTMTMGNTARILYAQWEDLNAPTPEPDIFTVTYDANGGIGSMSDDTEYETGDTVTVLANLFTKEGYDFVEFNTADDGSGTSYQAGDTFVMDEENVILFAIWEEQDPSTTDPEDTYTVTYDANGGSGTVTDAEKYEAGAEVTVKANGFTRSGYDFVEFNTANDGSGTAYQAGDTFVMGEEDVTLYAIWKENNSGGGNSSGSKGGSSSATYTITYRSEYSSSRPTDSGHKSGASVTLKAHSIFTDLELPEGVVFKGWSLTSSDSEVDYAAGDKITISRSLTLYAVYGNVDKDEEEFVASAELESRAGEYFNLEDHSAYVSGYPDGTVRPEANITREEVTAIFYRLLTSSARSRYETSASSFSDVEPGRWSEAAIATMQKAGIVSGDTDGAFRPGAAITRAEAAVIAARFTSGSYTGANQFTDISAHWASSYINAAAAIGWMSGDGNGSFRPDDYITRAEMMAMINNMLQRNPGSAADLLDGMVTFRDNADSSAWYYLHVQEATNAHNYEKSDSGRETWTELR